MNKKSIIIVSGILILFVLLLSQLSSAFWWIVADIIESSVEAVVKFFSALGYRMAVAGIVDQMTYTPIFEATNGIPKLILLNPEIMVLDVNGNLVPNPLIDNMVKFMISIVIPFYIFGIVSTAFYLLFLSGSPMGRTRAKAGLLKLLVSIPLIFLTIPILHLIINISEYATAFVLSLVNVNIGIEVLKNFISFLRSNYYADIWYAYWPAMRHIANVLMFSGFFFAIIFMRYYILIVYTILFPLTIFLYAFRFTKKMGAMLFTQTIWWILTQFIMGVIFLGICVAALSLPFTPKEDLMLYGLFGAGGFIALATAPLIAMAVANWKSTIGMVRDLMYTPWISMGAMMIGLGYEEKGEVLVSPPPPIGPPRIPPPT